MLFIDHDDPLELISLKVRLLNVLQYLDMTEHGPWRAQADAELRKLWKAYDALDRNAINAIADSRPARGVSNSM